MDKGAKFQIFSSIVLILLCSSLFAGQGTALPENEYTNQEQYNHDQNFSKQLGYGQTLSDIQTDIHDGSTFNRSKAFNLIRHHRTIDGGYTDEGSDAVSTFYLYHTLNVTGENSFITGLSNYFDEYVLDRYIQNSAGSLFSQYPVEYEINAMNTRDEIVTAIMYLDLGHTFSQSEIDRLQSIAENTIYQSSSINNIYEASLLLNKLGSLGNIAVADVISNIDNFQDDDPSSLTYGGVREHSFVTDVYIYSPSAALKLLKTVTLYDGIIAYSDMVNVTSLDLFLDQLRDKVDRSVSTSWNYMNLNYNETYVDDLEYDEPLTFWRDNIETFWTATFSALASRAIIESLSGNSNYNRTAVNELVLNQTLNTYWLDDDSNGQIDRLPYHRYMSHYQTNHHLFGFAQNYLLFDLSNDFDNGFIYNVSRSRILETGGVSRTRSSGSTTSLALQSLYYMDRNALNYINQIDLTKTRNFFQSLAYSWTDSMSFSAFSSLRSILYDTAQDFYYGDPLSSPIHSQTTKDIIKTNDLVPGLDLFSSLDTQFRTNLENYVLSSSSISSSGLISPTDAEAAVSSAYYLGIQDSLDTSSIETDLPYFQGKNGGFMSMALFWHGIRYVNELTKLPSAEFDHAKYLDFIRSHITTTELKQGISGIVGEDYINIGNTFYLLKYLKQRDSLNTLISENTLNVTKLTNLFDTGSYSGLWDMYHAIGGLDLLGYKLDGTDTELQTNITAIVEYVSSLQINSSEATSEVPAGSFASSIDENGDKTISSSNALVNTLHATYILNVTGNLTSIDQMQTIDYLKSLQISSTNPDERGLFKRSPSSFGTVIATSRATRSLRILNATPDIQDALDAINYRISLNTPLEGEMYNPTALFQATEIIGSLNLTSSFFNISKVNIVLDHHVTIDGFLNTERVQMRSTFSAGTTLKRINQYDLINTSAMWNFIASMQFKEGDQKGGFANAFDNMATLRATYEGIFVLFNDNRLDLINTTLAQIYVNNIFESTNANSYLQFSIQIDIWPVVRTLSLLDNEMLVELEGPIWVMQGNILRLNISITNVWHDGVIGVTNTVYFNSTESGTADDLGNGDYTFTYNTTSLDLGVYNTTVVSSIGYYPTVGLSLLIEIISEEDPTSDPADNVQRTSNDPSFISGFTIISSSLILIAIPFIKKRKFVEH